MALSGRLLLQEHEETRPLGDGTLTLEHEDTVGQGAFQTTLTRSVTLPSVTDGLLIVFVCSEGNAGGTAQINTVTWQGTNMSVVGRAKPANWSMVSGWILPAPASGTGNIVITASESQRMDMGLFLFSNVNQSEPLTPVVFASGTGNTSSSLTVPQVGSTFVVVDGLSIDSNPHSATVGANQTEDWDHETVGGSHTGAGSHQSGADGGVMSWTWTTSAPFSHIAFGIRPNDAAGGGPIQVDPDTGILTLSGVGPVSALRALPSVAQLDLLGLAPTVSDRSLPGQGVLTALGNAPTVRMVTSAGSATLDLVGLSPSLIYRAAPGVSTLELLGLAPTARVHANAGIAALDLIGFAPSIGADLILEPDVGVLTLLGLSPELIYRTEPSAATLTAIGSAPTVHTQAAPGQGTLTLVGLAPTVADQVAAGTATLSLVGNPPTLVFVAVPNTGGMTLLGFAPTVDAGGGIVIVTRPLKWTLSKPGWY